MAWSFAQKPQIFGTWTLWVRQGEHWRLQSPFPKGPKYLHVGYGRASALGIVIPVLGGGLLFEYLESEGLCSGKTTAEAPLAKAPVVSMAQAVGF